MQNLKYPIGNFTTPANISETDINGAIIALKKFPDRLESICHGITDENWINKYRPDGWNIIQLVHHLADSHTNAFLRFKLTLTESQPIIKPYNESQWALLPDVNRGLIESSLNIIKHTHKKWVMLMFDMTLDEWYKNYFHPETNTSVSLAVALLMYKWHGEHHLKHIELALKNKY